MQIKLTYIPKRYHLNHKICNTIRLIFWYLLFFKRKNGLENWSSWIYDTHALISYTFAKVSCSCYKYQDSSPLLCFSYDRNNLAGQNKGDASVLDTPTSTICHSKESILSQGYILAIYKFDVNNFSEKIPPIFFSPKRQTTMPFILKGQKRE